MSNILVRETGRGNRSTKQCAAGEMVHIVHNSF